MRSSRCCVQSGRENTCCASNGVASGTHLLLHATTPVKVRQATSLIDAIEAQHIAPQHVGVDDWCVAHQRLVASREAPPNSAAEHAAVLPCRALRR